MTKRTSRAAGEARYHKVRGESLRKRAKTYLKRHKGRKRSTSGVIKIKAHTRADGTKVKAHKRRRGMSGRKK